MNLQDQRNSSTRLSLNPFTSEFRPIALIQLLLIPLIFVGVLSRAVNSPEWFGSFHLDLLYLYFAPLLLFMRTYSTKHESDRGLWLHVAQISVLILLTFVLLRQHNRYIPSEGRAFHVALVFLLFAVYPLFEYDYVEFLRSRAVYIGAYVVILGAYFFHVNEMSAGSTKASFVVYMAMVFGLSLFFIPRYVSRNVFLWGISLVSSFSAATGLLLYAIGDFSVSWLHPQLFQATAKMPLFGTEFHFLQSIFENPNTLGGLAFAGAFAALVLTIEYARRKSYFLVPFAAMMFLVNSAGLYFSYSRASWLAFGIASVVYVGYLVLGRRSVPFTVVTLGVLTILFLGGILLSVIPIDPNGRFALWKGGVRAVLHAPSSLGYGVVNTKDVIAPFVYNDAYRGYSPHNSYVQIFLSIGIVGGLAYLTIVVGSLIEGVVRKDSVDVVMLGFAAGFAVHQTFEVYTLFNNAIASILATLVFGYLICGYRKQK